MSSNASHANSDTWFAAVLVALWVVYGAYSFGELFYTPHEAAKRGYQVAVEESDSTGNTAKKEAPLPVLLASGNAGRGEKIAKKCLSCHTFEQGGANKVGPNLWGILGDNYARTAGFNYSNAMKAKQAEGGGWDYDNMAAFLKKPSAFLKGTKMAFVGIKKGEDLADLLLYIRSMSNNPNLPLPAVPAMPEENAPATAESINDILSEE